MEKIFNKFDFVSVLVWCKSIVHRDEDVEVLIYIEALKFKLEI